MSLTMLPKLLAYFNTILTLPRNLDLLQRVLSERNSVRHKGRKRTVSLQTEKKIIKVDERRRKPLNGEDNLKVLWEPTLRQANKGPEKCLLGTHGI